MSRLCYIERDIHFGTPVQICMVDQTGTVTKGILFAAVDSMLLDKGSNLTGQDLDRFLYVKKGGRKAVSHNHSCVSSKVQCSLEIPFRCSQSH